MSDTLTLENIERLALQLPALDRLKLAAHIYENLNNTSPNEKNPESTEMLELQKKLAKLGAWLVECEEVGRLS
jgi:hypothetical protein